MCVCMRLQWVGLVFGCGYECGRLCGYCVLFLGRGGCSGYCMGIERCRVIFGGGGLCKRVCYRDFGGGCGGGDRGLIDYWFCFCFVCKRCFGVHHCCCGGYRGGGLYCGSVGWLDVRDCWVLGVGFGLFY